MFLLTMTASAFGVARVSTRSIRLPIILMVSTVPCETTLPSNICDRKRSPPTILRGSVGYSVRVSAGFAWMTRTLTLSSIPVPALFLVCLSIRMSLFLVSVICPGHILAYALLFPVISMTCPDCQLFCLMTSGSITAMLRPTRLGPASATLSVIFSKFCSSLSGVNVRMVIRLEC